MLNHPTLVTTRVAVAAIFLLLFASTNLTSANSVSSTDSPSKKDYNVQISESGKEYNETIEVDTEKQTELFKVPAHNNVDQSNILHDFKTKMSLLLLPEKKICYLLPLSEELPSPTELENDLDHAERTSTDETTIFDSKWVVDSEMTNRSLLSEELANFCPEYPIYQVQIMEDSMNSTSIQTEGTKHRNRRYSWWRYPAIHYCNLCRGGKRSVSYSDITCCSSVGGYWYKRRGIASRTCYSVRRCYRGWFWRRCRTKHYINYVYCYEYKCRVN